MKFELFIDQPSLDLKKGIQVTKDTETTFKNDNVEQVIKDLKLETIMDEEGTNGFNSYKSKSHISVTLNEGDILMFDPDRGYYLPPYPKTRVELAAADLAALKDVKLQEE
ncbi:MAG: hypothetical protein IJA50_03750 [Firmicutes bacterium]|nr:hypothetical protein [Bacillota bacterium]